MNKSKSYVLWMVAILTFQLSLAYSQSTSEFTISGPIAAEEP